MAPFSGKAKDAEESTRSQLRNFRAEAIRLEPDRANQAKTPYDTLPKSWRANAMVPLFGTALHDCFEQGNQKARLAPSGIILTTLAMVAEMELSFIKERQRVGIEAAKAKGVYKGRKRTVDREEVQRLRGEGGGATEIARRLGIGRATVYKVLGTQT